MIEGEVNAHHETAAGRPLTDSSGQSRGVKAVIETGFNGYLNLPPALVAELGLRRLGQKSSILANGSRDILATYGATVLWDGQSRFVDADEADSIPPLGMSMLDEHDLSIQVGDGGRVVIQAGE